MCVLRFQGADYDSEEERDKLRRLKAEQMALRKPKMQLYGRFLRHVADVTESAF